MVCFPERNNGGKTSFSKLILKMIVALEWLVPKKYVQSGSCIYYRRLKLCTLYVTGTIITSFEDIFLCIESWLSQSLDVGVFIAGVGS